MACHCSALFAPGEEAAGPVSLLPASQRRVRQAPGTRRGKLPASPRPPSATELVLQVAHAPAPAKPRGAGRRCSACGSPRLPPARGGRRTCASVADVRGGGTGPRQAGGGGLYLWKKEKSEAGERSKVCLWPGRICPRRRQESPVKTQSPAHQPPAHQPRGESAHPGDRRGPRTPACCRALGGRRGRGQRRGWGWGRPSSGDAGTTGQPPGSEGFLSRSAARTGVRHGFTAS